MPAINQIVLATELGLDHNIGTDVANKITINIDGSTILRDGVTGELSAPVGSMTYVPATHILTYTNGSGGTQNIDLSALTTDIYVDGGTFDAATSVLTLTDNSGTTGDITVDLSTLLGVSTDAGNLLNDGTDGKPLFTKTNLDAQTTIATSNFGTQLFRGVNI